MIPKNIGKEHVIRAIGEIQKVGFPKNRVPIKYLLKRNSGYYPPKYVVSLANKYINGNMLDSSEFDAGDANGFLQRLGFEIVGAKTSERPIPSSVKTERKTKSSRSKRNEGCLSWKKVVK